MSLSKALLNDITKRSLINIEKTDDGAVSYYHVIDNNNNIVKKIMYEMYNYLDSDEEFSVVVLERISNEEVKLTRIDNITNKIVSIEDYEDYYYEFENTEEDSEEDSEDEDGFKTYFHITENRDKEYALVYTEKENNKKHILTFVPWKYNSEDDSDYNPDTDSEYESEGTSEYETDRDSAYESEESSAYDSDCNLIQ